MTPRARRRLLVALLAALVLGTVPAAGAASVAGTARRATVMLVKRKAEVRRLQNSVSAQESRSQAAAAKLKRQDAEIAELQRQLQAAQQAGRTAGEGT